jgi:hypothetical protein
MTDEPPDPDVQFAETPTGNKAHLVDFAHQSMLALGTNHASNYASSCGHAPSYWVRLTNTPDPDDVCQRCATYRLDRLLVTEAPVGKEFLERAGDVDG